MTCLLLCTVTVDEDHASMEASDTGGEFGSGSRVVRVNGSDETAAAAVRECDRVVQIVVAHDCTDRTKGLDLVNGGRTPRVSAMQEDRRQEGAANDIGAD